MVSSPRHCADPLKPPAQVVPCDWRATPRPEHVDCAYQVSCTFSQNKRRPPAAASGLPHRWARSDEPYVLRFLALAAGSDVELDGLAFLQAPIAVALDVGVMHEDVLAPIT
jgi:hypothetical protein